MANATWTHSRANKDIYRRSVRPVAEIFYTALGLVVTTVASVLLSLEIIGIIRDADHSTRLVIEQVLFAGIVAGLIYGNLLYQLTRIGYMRRLKRHRSEPDPDLSRHFNPSAPRLTLLIPSYREEIRVIRQSLISSALQHYPNKRVVLLIDDPPQPARAEATAALEAARDLPGEIQQRLDSCADMVAGAAAAFRRRAAGRVELHQERTELAQVHAWVAEWFRQQAKEHSIVDHSDELFTTITYLEPAELHQRRSDSLLAGESLARERIELEYRRLEAIFRVEMTHFERKRFANLSHEPNKAMNVNSYIGLIGGAYTCIEGANQRLLESTTPERADLVVPDADYVITLDADSILYPDYALRLVNFMEEPGHERTAVIQTPYSAVPGPPGLLERIAGATTDIQYNVHQGFADHAGTYWVGANALLRMRALRDICETERIGDYEIKRYISDRTVIEDTESSVDLLARGWGLYNFPERLSFSATPADFGALLVQRRRWSNGGLIILPKLLRHLFLRRNPFSRIREGFFRIHYLVSPILVNVGVPILLIYPFENNLRSPWLPLTALPYFFFYGRDMRQIGYGLRDLPRVYAFNLMLIPVNLGGICQSVRQIITGKTIAFQRTPKVIRRTVAPNGFVIAVYALTIYAFTGATFDLVRGLWLHGLFALFSGASFLYATVRFVRPAPIPITTLRPEASAPPTLALAPRRLMTAGAESSQSVAGEAGLLPAEEWLATAPARRAAR